MYEKCGSELERPYPSLKGKEKAYKLGEIVFLMGGRQHQMVVRTAGNKIKASFNKSLSQSPVSYTHLDVYKRQLLDALILI